MRTIISIIIFHLSTVVIGQTIITGTITSRQVDCWLKFTKVNLILNDSIDESHASITNFGVPFVLITPDVDTIGIAINYCNCGLFIIKNIPLVNGKVNNLGVVHVDFDKRTGQCPINSNDKVIPEAYGLPTKSMQKSADKGEIHLGGCNVSCMEKTFYCTVHKLTF